MLLSLPEDVVVVVDSFVIMFSIKVVDSVVKICLVFALLNQLTETITIPTITNEHTHTIITRVVRFFDLE